MRKEDAAFHRNVAASQNLAKTSNAEVHSYAPQAPLTPSDYGRGLSGTKKAGIVRKAVDFVTGTRRVDNEANPDSALNRNRRAAREPVNPRNARYEREMNRAFRNTTQFGKPKK